MAEVTLKRRVRGAVEAVALACGVVGLMERRMRQAVTVLMYHRVLPDAEAAAYPFEGLAMPESAFRTQMAWLARNARVLPVGEALAAIGKGNGSPRPLVAVTFDDGYADNRSLAAPIAEAAGVRMTFFVSTGFVGGGPALWFDRAHGLLQASSERDLQACWQELGLPAPRPETEAGSHNERIRVLKYVEPARREALLSALAKCLGTPREPENVHPMSIEDVRALAAAGHEVASHADGHNVLTTLSDAELRRELEESRARLAEWTGREVVGLAYPNGDHDERVLAAVRAAGYRWACTTRRGAYVTGTDPLTIPRRNMDHWSVLDAAGGTDQGALRCELSGLRDLMLS